MGKYDDLAAEISTKGTAMNKAFHNGVLSALLSLLVDKYNGFDLAAIIRQNSGTQDALTTSNFAAQIKGPLDSYFRDRNYEAVNAALKNWPVAHAAPTPGGVPDSDTPQPSPDLQNPAK